MNKSERTKIENLLVQEKTNPVSLFVPNGAQAEWIRLIGNHQDGLHPRTKVLSAANKIGKSASTVAILANIIWSPQSKAFDYPIYREWPYPKIAWICSTESALKEIIVPEMKKWFPVGKYEINKEGDELSTRLRSGLVRACCGTGRAKSAADLRSNRCSSRHHTCAD